MAVYQSVDKAGGLAQAAHMLAAKVGSSTPGRSRGVVRHEIEIDPVDPLVWLDSQKSATKIYWRDKSANLEVAGIDTADILTSTGSNHTDILRRVAQKCQAAEFTARYYGGCRFDCESRRTQREKSHGNPQFAYLHIAVPILSSSPPARPLGFGSILEYPSRRKVHRSVRAGSLYRI